MLKKMQVVRKKWSEKVILKSDQDQLESDLKSDQDRDLEKW